MARSTLTQPGDRFGRLVVIAEAPVLRPGCWQWLCRCDCGGEKIVLQYSLRGGATKSCGCLQRELAGARATTHGCTRRGANPPEFRAWKHLRQRCSNLNDKQFPDYGARGITVCARWDNSFANFLADMGTKPTAAHSIDRIDNEGNYEPGNCRWTTRTEQNRNTRRNRMITWQGRTQCLAAWAEELGMEPKILRQRIHRGWSVEKAFTTPVSETPRKPAKAKE